MQMGEFTAQIMDPVVTLQCTFVVVVSTHSIDPCLWGEFDHPGFGPPASLSLHLASSSITPAGSVHKSRGDSVVRMWVQLRRWCLSCVWVLQRGHSGDGCDLESTCMCFMCLIFSLSGPCELLFCFVLFLLPLGPEKW